MGGKIKVDLTSPGWMERSCKLAAPAARGPMTVPPARGVETPNIPIPMIPATGAMTVGGAMLKTFCTDSLRLALLKGIS